MPNLIMQMGAHIACANSIIAQMEIEKLLSVSRRRWADTY